MPALKKLKRKLKDVFWGAASVTGTFPEGTRVTVSTRGNAVIYTDKEVEKKLPSEYTGRPLPSFGTSDKDGLNCELTRDNKIIIYTKDKVRVVKPS